MEPRVAEAEVDESRPGDLDGLDVRDVRVVQRRRPARTASSRGLRPAAFAVANATFVDQSPCSGTRGRSSTISPGGSTPSAASEARTAAERSSLITR